MPTEYTDIAIRARIDDYVKEMKKLPGVSEKEVKAATKAMEKSWKLPDMSGQSKAQFDKMKKGATVALGGVVGDIEDVMGALGALGPAALAGAAGFAAVAASAGGLVVVGKGAAALAQWMSDATAETEKLAPILELIAGTEIVSAGSIAAAADYQEQLALLETTSAGFSQVLVERLAPAMSDTAAIAAGASIELLKLYDGINKSGAAFDEAHPIIAAAMFELDGAVAIGGTAASLVELADSLGVATGAWSHFAEVGRGAQAAIEDDAAALIAWEAAKKRNDAADDKLLEKTKAINEQIGQKQVAALKAAEAEWDKHVDVINKMIEQGYADRTRDETQAVYDLADAEIARTKAINDMFDAGMAAGAQERFQLEQDASNEAIALAEEGAGIMSDLQQAALDQALAFGEQLADQAQQKHEDEIARLDDVIAKRRENMKAAIKAGNTERAAAIKGRIDEDKHQQEIEKKQMMRAYVASKAIAIMGIAISTAQATMALLASPAIAALGPGAPGVAAGLAIGTGVIQAAAVAAAPPPKAHIGRAPDEVDIRATKKEAILSPQGVAAAGGAQGVNALNRGQAPGGGVPAMYISFDGGQPRRLVAEAIRGGAHAEIRGAIREPVGAGRYAR